MQDHVARFGPRGQYKRRKSSPGGDKHRPRSPPGCARIVIFPQTARDFGVQILSAVLGSASAALALSRSSVSHTAVPNK